MSDIKKHPEIEYFRRCFKAVDGLWFMKVEDAHGLEEAFELDRQVWEVMGKIQVRTIRQLLDKPDNTAEALAECIRFKMNTEDYGAEVQTKNGEEVEVRINRCPWLQALQKSKRTDLGPSVAAKICSAEYAAWASEFNARLIFSPEETLCAGKGCCKIRFTANSKP